jgi:hypothetical protein
MGAGPSGLPKSDEISPGGTIGGGGGGGRRLSGGAGPNGVNFRPLMEITSRADGSVHHLTMGSRASQGRVR